MQISCLILAAGKGTRMKSSLPKVLHPVFFQPMVCHVLAAVEQLAVSQTIVVVGHQHERVQSALAHYPVSFAVQAEQNGTGHAVQVCEQFVAGDADTVLILCGDTPLVRGQTLQAMIDRHRAEANVLSVMATEMADPTGYGRMVCDEAGQLLEIVEEKDATLKQRRIREVNAGIYLVDRNFLFKTLALLDTENAQGEIYLTDIVGLARQRAVKAGRYICPDNREILGVNSRQQLAVAHDIKQQEFFVALWDAGVTLQRPATLSVHPGTVIGADTVIGANCSIRHNVRIGQRCDVGANTCIEESFLGDDVVVGPGSVLVGVRIDAGNVLPAGTVRVSGEKGGSIL